MCYCIILLCHTVSDTLFQPTATPAPSTKSIDATTISVVAATICVVAAIVVAITLLCLVSSLSFPSGQIMPSFLSRLFLNKSDCTYLKETTATHGSRVTHSQTALIKEGPIQAKPPCWASVVLVGKLADQGDQQTALPSLLIA